VYFNKVLECNCNTLILMIVSLPFTINVTNLTILSFVSWFKILLEYGASIVFLFFWVGLHNTRPSFMVNENIPRWWGISFKLHNFVQVTFYHQCEELYKYPHLLNQCLVWYNEHGISIFKKIILFSGLQYYHKIYVGITFLIGFTRAMQYPSKL
jgi:hypothetical protein